jgi:hypothetical protein
MVECSAGSSYVLSPDRLDSLGGVGERTIALAGVAAAPDSSTSSILIAVIEVRHRSEPTLLLLKHHRRPTDSLPLEVHDHFDAISDFDERNAAVHTVVLPVESHGAGNRALAGPLAGNCKN